MDKFAALAEPNRRRIMELLARRQELSATDISARFAISPSAVSQHLKVLREAKLVRRVKRAQQRIYSLNPEGIEDMWEWLSRMRVLWNDRFDSLEDYLKSEKSKSSREKQK